MLLCFRVFNTTRNSHLHELSRQAPPCSADAEIWKDQFRAQEMLHHNFQLSLVFISSPQNNISFLPSNQSNYPVLQVTWLLTGHI